MMLFKNFQISSILSEAATRGSLYKKLLLKFHKIHRKFTCPRASFLIKLKAEACNFIKKRLWHKSFPVNIANFLRTLILKNICKQLLLQVDVLVLSLWLLLFASCTKMKFSIKDFFSKSEQICRKLWIWAHLLKKSLIENFVFCAVAIALASVFCDNHLPC